jgi:uncharacterized protein YigA (DUF484 family)
MTEIKGVNSVNDRDVAGYLERNLDFFADRHKLLMSLNLPHHRGGTVSLVEKQVSLLRERNLNNKKKLDTYVLTAKSNDLIFANCQKLILSLIGAEEGDEFFSALEKSFKKDFKCKAYSLIIYNDEPKQINHFTSLVSKSAAKEYVAGLMKNTHATLGALRPSEQDFLFRHQSNKVQSAAVLPLLRNKKQYALLAIGSEDPDYFRAGMGTVFIEFIADVLSRMLPKQIGID